MPTDDDRPPSSAGGRSSGRAQCACAARIITLPAGNDGGKIHHGGTEGWERVTNDEGRTTNVYQTTKARRSAGCRLQILRFPVLGSRFSALGSRFSALGSRLSVLRFCGSRFSALGSRFCGSAVLRFSVLGSRLSVLRFCGSAVLGSRFAVLGSRFCGSQFSVLSSRFSVLSSRFPVLRFSVPGSRLSVLSSRFSVLRFSVLGSWFYLLSTQHSKLIIPPPWPAGAPTARGKPAPPTGGPGAPARSRQRQARP